MNALELAEKLSFKVINEGDGATREIEGIYCCDLLSLVMGRAKANDAWITVMGNINTIAVCVLSDVSCVIISEGLSLDNEALEKAKQQDICVLSSEHPTFETSLMINQIR